MNIYIVWNRRNTGASASSLECLKSERKIKLPAKFVWISVHLTNALMSSVLELYAMETWLLLASRRCKYQISKWKAEIEDASVDRD